MEEKLKQLADFLDQMEADRANWSAEDKLTYDKAVKQFEMLSEQYKTRGDSLISTGANYALDKLTTLVSDLLGNLVTGIPEATFQLLDGRPGEALLTLGAAVGTPFAKLIIKVGADGVVAVTKESGELIIDGLTSDEAKQFAKWLNDNSKELAAKSVEEIRKAWGNKKDTQEDFVTLTIGGKDWTVTKGTDTNPMRIIDNQGKEHSLDSPAG